MNKQKLCDFKSKHVYMYVNAHVYFIHNLGIFSTEISLKNTLNENLSQDHATLVYQF
jgi:hypothetical protein